MSLLPPYPNQSNGYFCCLTTDCLGYLNPVKKKSSKLGYLYRCTICLKTIAPTNGTWFRRSHLSLMEDLKALFVWCQKQPCKSYTKFLKCNKNTSTSISNEIREVAIQCFLERDNKIGGPDKHVEIDETMIFTRKYNKGRLLSDQKRQVWLVGGIERESGNCFMEIVEKRSKNFLNELILRKVEKDSIIITDEWKGYNDLEQLGYTHHRVCHKYEWIHPDDPTVHTQTVERLWKSVKNSIPKESHGKHRADYIVEFLFRYHYFKGKCDGEMFQKMLQLIAAQYVSPLFNVKVT